MNKDELKAAVIKKFFEGKTVPIRIAAEGKKGYNSTTAEIIKFNPDTVLTKHNGYLESFTYWEFLQMTSPRDIKQSQIYLPDKVVRHHIAG